MPSCCSWTRYGRTSTVPLWRQPWPSLRAASGASVPWIWIPGRWREHGAMTMTEAHPGQMLRSGSETFLRILFGLFMAVIAVALTFGSPFWFAAVTCLMMMLAGREWHRMVRDPAQREAADRRPIHIQTAVTGATLLFAATVLLVTGSIIAVAVLAAGAVVAFVLARMRDDNPLWHAGGVLY